MILGYGICGAGEADRYLEQTLEEFKRLCDETIIVLNNAGVKEIRMIERYGFRMLVDNREWGLEQNHIKQTLMSAIKAMRPDYCVCLDMDEVFDPELTKEKLLSLFETGDSLYFYIVNLWNDGWNRKWSFWNIRAWKFNDDLKILNKPLHCGLAPEWTYYSASYAPYFIRHYGLMKKDDRQKKIERYQKYDPHSKYKNKEYYEALAKDDNEPLDEEEIRKAIVKEIGVQIKRKGTCKKVRKLFYIQRFRNGKDIGTVDIPESDVKETLANNPEWVLLGEVGNLESDSIPKGDKLECTICGEIQETAECLLIHKQTHK